MSKTFTRTTRLAAGIYSLKDILILGYDFNDQRAVDTIKRQQMTINEEVPTEQNFLKKVTLSAGDTITVQIGWGYYNVEVI